MTAPESQPKPKRSRRMVVWMIAVPIVILLLALAGANWKTFHLAYAKHLLASDDPDKQWQGVDMVLRTHLRKGMPLEEVRRLLAPARVTETISRWRLPVRGFTVSLKGYSSDGELCFDENDRLLSVASWGAGR